VFKIKQLIKKEFNVKLKLAFLAALLAASAAQAARADALFDTNSTFQVVGGNSPDSFSNTVALTPGTTSLGSGALSLTLTIVPASGGAEWLVFNYSTTAGGAISQPNQNWSLSQNGLVALQPLNFIASYAQFNNNGTAIAPSYSVFGQTLMNNPVPGFTGFGQGANGFKSPDCHSACNIDPLSRGSVCRSVQSNCPELGQYTTSNKWLGAGTRICSPGCSCPRALHLGDDDPGLRGRRLHCISPQGTGFNVAGRLNSADAKMKTASGRFFVWSSIIDLLDRNAFLALRPDAFLSRESFGHFQNVRHDVQDRNKRKPAPSSIAANPISSWGLELRFACFGLSSPKAL
jgi:hypothetical protein